MTNLPGLVSLRTYGLAFAVALSPAVLQQVSCETGVTTLSSLKFDVAGQNQITFISGQSNYAVSTNSDTAIVTVQATDPAARVSYQWSAGGQFIEEGLFGVGGGQATLRLPLGEATLRIMVMPPGGAVGHYVVNTDRRSAFDLVTFEIDDPPLAAGDEAYVLGDLPELGGSDVTQAVKLVSSGGTHWEVTVSLPVNRTYTYQFYRRFSQQPDIPTNGAPIGSPIAASTADVALVPAAKVMYAHSTFDPPVVHWRQDSGSFQTITMQELGPGRTPTEKRWVAGPFGGSHRTVELYLTNLDGSLRDPVGTATYETVLEAFFLQDENIFSYEPAAMVSAPRRGYEVLADGFSSTKISSSILGEDYDYRVFLPRGYDEHTSRHYPVLYLQDGTLSWDDFWPAWPPVDLDGALTAELVRQGRVGELIMVGAESVVVDYCAYQERRVRDYTPPGNGYAIDNCAWVAGEGDRYVAFLRDELKPLIDAQYRTLPDAEHTFNSGFSAGGVLALYAGWEFDDTFGHVGSQSIASAALPYYSRLATDPKPSARIYMDHAPAEYLLRELEIYDALLARAQEPFVLGRDLRYFMGDVAGHSRPAAGSRWPEMLSFLYPATAEAPECYDGLDNDGDGLTDHVPGGTTNDPDCTSALAPSESGSE